MKKKALSLLLTLALCLSLLPTAAWATEDEGGSSPAAQSGETHADHCICGANHHVVGSHTNEKTVTWTEWTYTDKLPDTKGNYYLKDNVTLSTTWEPVKDTVLCLNGKTIQANGDFDVIKISSDSTFALTDCKDTGKVTHINGNGSGIYNYGGEFYMYGGSITGNNAGEGDSKGGGVYNCSYSFGSYTQFERAFFDMYGGDIYGNTAKDGGGIYNWGGTVKMYGGDVRDNTATNGSGVYNRPTSEQRANFYMSGTASIKDNEASANGGGVYFESDTSGGEVYFRMSGSAKITSNTAATNGGGIYMNGGVLVVSGNPEITGNTKRDRTTASNVYLPDSGKAVTIDGNFSGTVGVTTGLTLTDNATVKVATGANNGEEKYFASDDGNYEIKLSGSDLVLAVKPDEHKHFLCGGDVCTEVGDHTDTNTTFTAWNETDKLPDTAGSYYLKDNVTLSSTWEPVSGTVLCLNGKTVQASGDFDVITIGNDVTFTLTDCTNNGKITHVSGKRGRGVYMMKDNQFDATFNMYGGNIVGNNTVGEYQSGVGVLAHGTFNMYNGSISDNHTLSDWSYGGGVQFTGTFNLYNGTITGNSCTRGGGGVNAEPGYIKGKYTASNFTMYDGVISNNTSSANPGGGMSASGDFTMHGGSITDNKATVGGGVYGGYRFTMTGGSITNNSITSQDSPSGGVYLSLDAKITFSGDVVIYNNTNASNKQSNFYWRNSAQYYVAPIAIGEGGLGANAKIGITTYKEPTESKPLVIVGANETNYSEKFISDAGYYVNYNDSKQLELSLTAQGHTHTWNKYVLDPTDHSRVLLYCSDSTCNASGGSVTVKAPTKLTYAGTPPRATVETSADWKGPEAGNITILYVKKLGEGSWTIFNTEPYTGTGTHYAYIRFLNNNNTIVEAYAEYDLVEKNDVTDKITFPSGQLTYTGSGLRYEKATISEGYNGKFTYTYWVPKGGSTGELDANGLPLAVGTYTVIATYEDDDNYGTARAILEVVAGSNNNNSSSSGGGGGGRTSYPVNAPSKSDNGTVTTSPKNTTSGSTVTITVKPDEGYVLDTITVIDSKGNTVKLTDKGDGKFSFVMPSGQVDVKATFTKAAEEETSPFDDVARSDYYYDAVKWAAEQGITGGTGSGKFSPADACTRAQIVTFLWRTAGSPAPKGMSSFTDVPADAYYAKAVAWAVENGITAGTAADKFSPDATCTRAHAVTFLFRLAKGSATGAPGFLDVAADAYYAQPVKWAVDNGITSGIGNGLFGPDNRCTRAQIVTFLYQADKI